MPAKRKASAGRQGAAKVPEAGTRRSTRGASATSESKSAVGTKRKASPSPTPAPKKAASAKKGRTRSPSPAPETRPVRGRSTSGKKVETKPAEKPTSRSASNQKGRVTRNVVQEEEKKTAETKSRSSSRGAKASETPKSSATPKCKTVTPSKKVATPKKEETPKQKATPRGRSATPKQTKETPKKAAVTPKQKSTPKQKTTPKQRQQTPKKKSEPAAKKETPKSTSKKTTKPESPPKTTRSRRSKSGEPAENVDLDTKSAATEESDKGETEVEKVQEDVDEDTKQSTTEESDKSEMAVDDKPTEEKKSVEGTDSGEDSTISEVVTVVASEQVAVKTDEVQEDNTDVDKEEKENVEAETAEETVKEQKSEMVENEEEESEVAKTEEEAEEMQTEEEEAEEMQTEDNVDKEEENEKENKVQEGEKLQSENEIEQNTEGSPEMEAEDTDETEQSDIKKDEIDQSEEVKSDEQPEDIEAVKETTVKESADDINLMTSENDNTAKENVAELNMAEVSATMQQSEENSVETSEGVTEETTVDLVENDSKEAVEVTSESSEELPQKVIELNEDSAEADTTEEPAVVNDVTNVDDVGNGSGDQELSKKVAPVEEISDDDIEEIDTKPNNIQGNGAADANEIEVIEFVDQEDKYVENCPTKRKFDDVENQEVDDTSPLKKARLSTGEEIQENGSSSQEDVAKDYVVIEMGDVPAPDSTEVQTSLPNPIFNRSFIPNPTFTGSSDNSKQFSIVSYNILADCHLFRNDYSFTESKYLQSEYRLKNVIEELRYLDADVVCLQEVDPKFFVDQLLPGMRGLGYEGVHKQREDEYYNEGEATFFKISRFSVVETEASTFSQLLKKELDGIDPDIREAVTKYTDLPDVVIVTKLQCKNTGREVTIGNVHIQWGEMKVPDAQCVQIASAVKEIVSKATGDNFPHIICGDFNSPPMSPGYLVARDGYPSGDETINTLMKIERLELPEGKKASLVNSLWPAFQHTSSSLRSAYSEAQGYEPEISSYNCVMCDTVDYIFYSSMSLENVGVLQTAAKEKVMETGGIPNRYFPSDHISLKAVLSFK